MPSKDILTNSFSELYFILQKNKCKETCCRMQNVTLRTPSEFAVPQLQEWSKLMYHKVIPFHGRVKMVFNLYNWCSCTIGRVLGVDKRITYICFLAVLQICCYTSWRSIDGSIDAVIKLHHTIGQNAFHITCFLLEAKPHFQTPEISAPGSVRIRPWAAWQERKARFEITTRR